MDIVGYIGVVVIRITCSAVCGEMGGFIGVAEYSCRLLNNSY